MYGGGNSVGGGGIFGGMGPAESVCTGGVGLFEFTFDWEGWTVSAVSSDDEAVADGSADIFKYS